MSSGLLEALAHLRRGTWSGRRYRTGRGYCGGM